MLILGRFAELYAEQGHVPELNYVEGEDDVQRVPDFRVFSSESAMDGWDVEITEILEPDRRRHSEYKSGQTWFDNPEPGPDYKCKLTSHVANELAKKFATNYPPGTWLVVYFQPDKLEYWLLRVRRRGNYSSRRSSVMR